MSVEPPNNGHVFGTPAPSFAAHDQLVNPAAVTLPGPHFRHEPAGFGPAPTGFPQQRLFGYPGPPAFFGRGQDGLGGSTGLAQRPNTLAILALVFAFCSPPAGLVLGLIARKQIAESGERGDGLALAGIIVGAFFTTVWLVLGIIAWAQLGQALAATTEAAELPG